MVAVPILPFSKESRGAKTLAIHLRNPQICVTFLMLAVWRTSIPLCVRFFSSPVFLPVLLSNFFSLAEWITLKSCWSRPCYKNHLSRHTQGASAHDTGLGESLRHVLSGGNVRWIPTNPFPQEIGWYSLTSLVTHTVCFWCSCCCYGCSILGPLHLVGLYAAASEDARLRNCRVVLRFRRLVSLDYQGALLLRCMSSCLNSLFLSMGVFCKASCGANDGYDDCRWHASANGNPMELTCSMDVTPFLLFLVDHCRRCETNKNCQIIFSFFFVALFFHYKESFFFQDP